MTSAKISTARKQAVHVAQMKLDLGKAFAIQPVPSASGPRAIEDDKFPFEALSKIAESESWRKEIHRPLSHIHKWWAQRLGSVFRAIALGSLAPKGANVMDLVYSRARFPEATVFDPFMGSGTTIIESLNLGARVIGRDINPVAFFLVRNAVAAHSRAEVLSTFEAIERDVASKLQSLYLAQLPDGSQVPVLYYFWVKQVACPACDTAVDLFSSYVFAQNAYPRKFPQAQAVCPLCGHINCVRFDATEAVCKRCDRLFNPSIGPARGQKARCPACFREFSILKRVREQDTPPAHRLYAKLVLLQDGRKQYLAADDFDRALFESACHELADRVDAFPIVRITPGYNTNQALNYNYRQWHEFFNARQLLCLSLLAERIRAIPQPALRELFACLFSGTLEFNNMFASYKGEGTGAVRHMFAHHILKPERAPIEANIWGTSKSSGSFSNLFHSRLIRAVEYHLQPTEVNGIATAKGVVYSRPFTGKVEPGLPAQNGFLPRAIYLACGDSSISNLPDQSIDLVVTDPPFFDNVHYSELADFFYAWQQLVPRGFIHTEQSTRSLSEVQDSDPQRFAAKLQVVFQDCNRVLKNEGLLVFTYHHSREEGWTSLAHAILRAGFVVVNSHPVKAELSLATPKSQTSEPIQLDIILVCRKNSFARNNSTSVSRALEVAANKLCRLTSSGFTLSQNDQKIVKYGQLLTTLNSDEEVENLSELMEQSSWKVMM